MKKFLAMILSALMLVSCAAFAEEGTEPAAETEAIVLEAAAGDAAIAEAGIEGAYVTFDQVYLTMFMPADFTNAKDQLTEEDTAEGMADLFLAEDGREIGVYYYDAEGESLEDYLATLVEEFGEEAVKPVVINGVKALMYDDVEDTSSWVVFNTEAGNRFQIYFAPNDDEAFMDLAKMMVATIQPEATEEAAA